MNKSENLRSHLTMKVNLGNWGESSGQVSLEKIEEVFATRCWPGKDGEH